MSRIICTLLIISCSNTFALGLSTGKDVLDACLTTKLVLSGQSSDSRSAEACIHFLMGFDSGQAVSSVAFEQPKIYCQPADTNIGHMVTAVADELASNNSYNEAPAGYAVWQALSKVWPCG